MSNKRLGYIVETKTGKIGRTFHSEGYVNGKYVVHIDEDGKILKMLCHPSNLKITGFID